MIRTLTEGHEWLEYPAFFNAYPIRNELSPAGCKEGGISLPYGDIFIDDYYGRIFDHESHGWLPKYGRSSAMPYYYMPFGGSLQVVDELRVPYRRVPIFSVGSLELIQLVYERTKEANRSHTMLLRGQTKTYHVEREAAESEFFFGDETVQEPSFLPSHLRNTFDPFFLKCMWQSQAAIILNDIGYEIGARDGEEAGKAFLKEVAAFRNSSAFVLFALGIAQHYGLPSVGLDLTDRLDVACWFATRTIGTDSSGKAMLRRTTSEHSPTVFVFRCPKDAVFDYKMAKPKGLPEGRPDRQSAWFGFMGWGAASNQLGSYLVCGFRLGPDLSGEIDPNLDDELFPKRSEDPVLDCFMNMRNSEKYEGEALRALQGVYHTVE